MIALLHAESSKVLSAIRGGIIEPGQILLSIFFSGLGHRNRGILTTLKDAVEMIRRLQDFRQLGTADCAVTVHCLPVKARERTRDSHDTF